MSCVGSILWGIALLSASGLFGCLFPSRSAWGQKLATVIMAAGGALGLSGVVQAFGEAAPPVLALPWFLPWGRFAVAVDPISAFFLVPVFVVPVLGSLYGWGYWKQSEHPWSGRRLDLSNGLLAGGMALVVVARDGVLLLMAWEAMAVAAYFAATAEEGNPEVRQAGWVYLIATHIGTLCLFAMFALWRHATGSFSLEPAQGMDAGLACAVFVLAVAGFGFKAGLMPLHVWLPGAHANAPSHVSAVMSGVMLKMGVYGIVRMTALLPVPPAWWGGTLLCAGAVSGLAGIAFAMGQQDIKRLLAYSSIENMGVIAMGLGLALLGRALGRPDWALLGLCGALLHVWNHSLFKSLLFLNAGAVIHAAHTRNMDRLGGLAKAMPKAAALFLVGAAAISALPPLNGFASEWLIYLGFLHGLDHGAGRPGAAVAVAAVALATIGAMAVACFVKLLGAVFLGSPRTESAQAAHDPPAGMLLPMAALAAGCLGLGLFPAMAAPLLERAAKAWGAATPGGAALSALAPLGQVSAVGLAVAAGAGALTLFVARFLRGRTVTGLPTWDCGYARPTPRIQYTGSSFARSLGQLFAFAVRPEFERPAVRGLFPGRAAFRSFVPDLVLDRFATPLFVFLGRRFSSLRIMQQGQTHLYLIYILAIMLILLLWGAM